MSKRTKLRWRWPIALVVLALVAAACGDDATVATAPPQIVTVTSIVEVQVPGETVTVEVPGPTKTVTVTSIVEVSPPNPMDLTGDARCQANKDAGEITFLTGFGFFPAISIAVVLAAEDQGFFDDMCLDVNIQPSVPGESIVLISANVIQFSTNQIGELSQARAQGAQSTIVLNWGHTPVHVLLVPETSDIMEPADFAGKTIGSVGGTLNAGLQGLLLNGGGLTSDDYEVAGRGYNPFVITEFDGGIAAFRSNEPDTLNNGGVPVRVFRPEDYGSVGTFAAIQVSTEFARLHPTAVEDWVRAVVMATDWAIQNPEDTVRISEDLSADGGWFEFEHELFRFNEEVKLSLDSTPEGHNFGRVNDSIVAQEVSAMLNFGILESLPNMAGLYTNQYVDAVYDDAGQIVWPGPIGE
jgi:ABC-type nitrate/sulfonate/bicarbonate transport system substrate-binding protein